MPRRPAKIKSTPHDDREALRAWTAAQKPPKPTKVDEPHLEIAAIGDERTRLHHAIRNGTRVVVEADEPGHPGYKLIGITDGPDSRTVMGQYVRADHDWRDQIDPEHPHLHRGGFAGWGWYTGEVPLRPHSVMWAELMRQANLPRHRYFAEGVDKS